MEPILRNNTILGVDAAFDLVVSVSIHHYRYKVCQEVYGWLEIAFIELALIEY